MSKIKQITRGQVLLVLLIILIISGTYFGIHLAANNSVDEYKNFENDLVLAAQSYIELEEITIMEDSEEVVYLRDIKQSISNDLKEKCTGYVYVSNQENIETEEYELIYEPYIKCGNKYTTPGYVND